MKAGLAALLHPGSTKRFLSGFWPNRPFAVHGGAEKWERLLPHPELRNLDSLINAWSGKVFASLPDFKDEYSSVGVSAEDAKKLHENGMALIFAEAEERFEFLVPWLHAIRIDLGLSQLTVSRCILYATPRGDGNNPHFDANANFVLQLSGEKLWRLAPNHSIKDPHTRHTMGAPEAPELARYSTKTFPKRMPAGAREIVLRAGSLLFVPRGYWHSTHATKDALSLNFTYSQPNWAEVLLASVAIRLRDHSHWRALADGIGSTDPAIRGRAEKRFDELLARLPADLGALGAEEIARDTEKSVGAAAKYFFERVPAVTIQVARRLVTVTKPGGDVRRIEVDTDVREFIRWVSKQKKGFTLSEAKVRLGDEFSSAGTSYVIANLIESGAIRAR